MVFEGLCRSCRGEQEQCYGEGAIHFFCFFRGGIDIFLDFLDDLDFLDFLDFLDDLDYLDVLDILVILEDRLAVRGRYDGRIAGHRRAG